MEPSDDDLGFSLLVAVIRDSELFLMNLAAQIADVTDLSASLREAVLVAQGEVEPRARALVVEIRSGDYNAQLHVHSLGDEDPAWRLKYVGYVNARRGFDAKDATSTAAGQEGLRKYVRWSKRPLQWLNVILGSVADVIPGAGGAYKELKESSDSVVDDVLDVEQEE